MLIFDEYWFPAHYGLNKNMHANHSKRHLVNFNVCHRSMNKVWNVNVEPHNFHETIDFTF